MKARIYFDGSARPNPGNMRIGVVVETPKEVVEISKDLGFGTNNVAEYMALIEGLKKALELGARSVEIFGDSRLVIEQIRGKYAVKSPHLRGLYLEVKELLSKFESFDLEWIPESENEKAHRLSEGF